MSTVAPEPRQAEHPGLQTTTLCAAFQRTAREHPDRLALRLPGGAVELTWSQYAERVRAITAGMAACGVGPGSVVGLMLTNRPEHHLADAAAMHLGATPYSIYATCPVDEVEWLVRDSGARMLVTEPAFADLILEVARRVDAVTTVVLVEGEAEGAITLGEFAGRGAPDFDFDAAWQAVAPESVVTLIYTSGTTGLPKGVQHTHASIMFMLGSMHRFAPVAHETRVVSFLPMAHIAERYVSHYSAMVFGYTITTCPDPRGVAAVLPEVRPTRFFAVPRIYEKVHSALTAAIDNEPDPEKAKGLRWAVDTGLAKVRAEQAGEPVSEELAAQYARADELVLSKLRAKIGFDDLDWASVGAAPTPYAVLEFFHAIGVPIAELWGMSEILLATINPPGRVKLGSVGVPLPGVEIRLAGDGEIECRGPNVMPGYRGRPDLTADTIDADGWLHTGDIGVIDEDGYLRVVDRKKELIINAAGKNMSPAKIEGELKQASPLIGQALCVGDRRPYNVALLTLDPDAAAAWAAAHGREGASTAEVAAAPEVLAAIAAAVEAANARLARVEQIKRFTLLPQEWLPGGEELTPTSKLKRKPIAAKYEAELEALYAVA